MNENVISWALPRIKRLLPIDEESLGEILTYTTSLSKQNAAEHLKNLLGSSPQALDFISSFNSRREDNLPSNPPSQANTFHDQSDRVPSPRRKANQKLRAPLHNAGPVRRPQGFGDTAGGYNKQRDDEIYASSGHKKAPSATSLADALSLSQNPETLQLPKTVDGGINTPSPRISRDSSPNHRSSPKLPPSAAGNLISDLPNVRAKQSKKHYPTHSQPQSGTSTPHGKPSTSTTTSSIADLTSAIASLELATNPSLSTERRRCECNASIHPLFATAPNCLNCGKIICALEGLQPCSFCDSPILSKEQVNSMIKALKEERGIERMITHNANVSLSGKGTPMFSSTPDSSSGDEASSAAARARAHRDKLLAFQRENAQRTKVHDEAADFDMTLTPGTTQWMSPVQRAAALKRQQKYLRDLEEANRPEWEKKRTIMSMSIKNGKLVKTYGREKAPALSTDAESEDEDDLDLLTGKQNSDNINDQKGAFSNNPLLESGKLIRPIWKSKDTEADAADMAKRERKSAWRRVQDDNDDNEKWILDGGLRGHGTESRLVDDGSQQECG